VEIEEAEVSVWILILENKWKRLRDEVAKNNNPIEVSSK
jgi:hypothetical protein